MPDETPTPLHDSPPVAEAAPDELAQRRALQAQVRQSLAQQAAPAERPINVPQYHPDALGYYVDAQQVGIIFANALMPYPDGRAHLGVTPVAVLRLPLAMAEQLIAQLTMHIAGAKQAQAEHEAAAAQVVAKAKLQADLQAVRAPAPTDG